MGSEEKTQEEILQRLTRVETKIDLMMSARDIANEALQSTKAAHRRLDAHDTIIRWAGTTIIGAVIVGVIAFFMRGVAP